MCLRNEKGQFIKGVRANPATEFKKGEHWRSQKPYWNKKWLEHEYINLKKSALQIANENSCKENNIFYFLKKHNIKTRDMGYIRSYKQWGLCGADNPMYNRCGEFNPNWKGGCSGERQLYYSSFEWKSVCSLVWKRDKAECQRCHIKHTDGVPMHIHHIITFADSTTRSDISNLILLCDVCHRWVHSKQNYNNDFIEVSTNDDKY